MLIGLENIPMKNKRRIYYHYVGNQKDFKEEEFKEDDIQEILMKDSKIGIENDTFYLHAFTNLPTENESSARIVLKVADYYFETNPVTKADLDEFPVAFKYFCKVLSQNNEGIEESNSKFLLILKGLLNLLKLRESVT